LVVPALAYIILMKGECGMHQKDLRRELRVRGSVLSLCSEEDA